jgi:hypothetical protein
MAGRNGMARGHGHAGETLAEVLVTTTLLGIVGVGVIGAIASILISNDADRQASHGETVMRSFAAIVEQANYAACEGTASPYGSSAGFVPPSYSNGAPAFRVAVTSVASWNGAGPTVVTTAPQDPMTQVTFRPCPIASGEDTGLQKLELRVEHLDRNGAVDPRGVMTSTVYKRDPA